MIPAQASFSRSDVLARHKKFDCSNSIRQFVCEKCHKGFYSEVSVREHYYKEHLKTFLYFCPKCNLGFHQNSRKSDHKKKGKCPQKDSRNQFPPRAPLREPFWYISGPVRSGDENPSSSS